MSNKEFNNTKIKQPSHGGGGFGKGPVIAQKPKDLKKSFIKLVKYSKSYIPLLIIATVLAIAGSIFNIIGPNKLSDIVDLISQGIMGSIDMIGIRNIAILLIVLYGLGYVFNYIQGFIMATIIQKLTFGLRNDISKKINLIPLKYFDSNSFGNILSRVTNDIDLLGQTLNQSLGTLVTSITMFLGSLFMMFYTNVTMTIAGILATFVGFFLMMFLIKKSQKYFYLQQQELGKINGHIEEIYSGHDVVKVYNGKNKVKKEFDGINNDLYKYSWKSQFISGLMMPIMTFVGNFGYLVVCVVGAILVMQNQITFGVIVAFMVYIRLFTQPLSQLAQTATTLQSAIAAGERVFEFLEEEELEDESKKDAKVNQVSGNVSFEDVKFGYDPKKIIIKDFSVDIKSGEKVAIVGPTGAGKTTIVNLLMRFYETNNGNISIDGVSIKDLTRENVHDIFCMVLQDTWLFEGTIRENIVYNQTNIPQEKVVEACKAVGIDHFIHTLENGYDTVLNDKINLSAGQKQLLTIARAMVKNSPLLILDEATSSVDTRTEVLIQEAMDKLMTNRTSFVIAHRLSTIKDADIILVMKDGNIIESGNHKDLLEKKGFYSDLYNSQFEKSE